jgi:hypothetical protein
MMRLLREKCGVVKRASDDMPLATGSDYDLVAAYISYTGLSFRLAEKLLELSPGRVQEIAADAGYCTGESIIIDGLRYVPADD